MWNKRTDEPGSSRTQDEPKSNPAPQQQSYARPPVPQAAPVALAPAHVPVPAPAHVPAATASAPKQSATIGPSMTIKGEIRAREELLVEGDVE
jgi:hypothetical protein